MRTQFFFRPSPLRLVWALCLVLLLPLAQTAANWHTLSHAQAGQPDENQSQRAIALDYCGQCLSVAVLTGAAPPSSVSLVLRFSGRHDLPLRTQPSNLSASIARAYDSRAPPFFLL
jgi:hypothetical protein